MNSGHVADIVDAPQMTQTGPRPDDQPQGDANRSSHTTNLESGLMVRMISMFDTTRQRNRRTGFMEYRAGKLGGVSQP
jgi:hypothetical protein